MPGAVFAVQAQLEGIAAGHEGAAFPLAFALGRLQGVNFGDDGFEGLARGLVIGVERFLAVLDPCDLRFQGRELAVRLAAALLARLLRFAEAAELGLGRLDAGPCRADLPGELGQAFTPVRGGAEQGREPLVLGGGGLFGVGFGGCRGVQGLGAVQDLPFQPGLLVADAGGLLLQLVRVPAGVRNHIRGAEQAAAFLGERTEGTEPFAPGGERIPVLPRGVQRGRGLGCKPFEDGLALPPGLEVAFDDGAACLERRFIRHVLRQRGLQRNEVVGQEP
ncbi:hypothetical protein SRABI128_05027 [Microbacterium sp. Bi128]|nr:hypothetical protein SRABI128_05027 [Microbacterium sp. Bi128]